MSSCANRGIGRAAPSSIARSNVWLVSPGGALMRLFDIDHLQWRIAFSFESALSSIHICELAMAF
jgi:hypothetical protein